MDKIFRPVPTHPDRKKYDEIIEKFKNSLDEQVMSLLKRRNALDEKGEPIFGNGICRKCGVKLIAVKGLLNICGQCGSTSVSSDV